MSRVKKRAYIATIIIIGALWLLAFYTNQQAKQLTVEFHEQTPLNKSPEFDISNPQPIPSNPDPATNQTPIVQNKESLTPPATPKPKVKTYFIDINQFQPSTQEVFVEKGTKVKLIFKTTKANGTTGLNVTMPQQKPVLIETGDTSEIEFTASENFNIAVSEETTPTNTLYSIKVTVN